MGSYRAVHNSQEYFAPQVYYVQCGIYYLQTIDFILYRTLFPELLRCPGYAAHHVPTPARTTLIDRSLRALEGDRLCLVQ